MSTVSIASGNIEGHILPFHSVCLPQVHDQRQMIQRVGTVEGSPFRLEMFWILEFESLSHFDSSPASCPDPLVISATLRHRARIP
ncbi:hypothetical protein AAG906_026257 [Vitis piasezkii]